MITSTVVKQMASYLPPAEMVERTLANIQAEGYKVLNVIETKVNKSPGCTDQAFLIIYDTGEEEDEKLHNGQKVPKETL